MEKKIQKKSNVQTVLIIILGIFIILVAIGAMVSSHISGSRNTNTDGTSKALVYTKISDFGDYSNWAQQQLQQGFSMCSIQNALAKTDQNVPYVQSCGDSLTCSQTDIGINKTTTCREDQASTR